MKFGNKLKISVLGLTTALVTPIVSLPLINATKPIAKADESGFVQSNIADFRVDVTDKSYFVMKFGKHVDYPQWQTFATVYKMHIDDSDVIENLQIPGTVVQDGVEYKVRMIDTMHDNSGKGTIKRLDLSKAEWLGVIWGNAFGKSPDPIMGYKCPYKIRAVNFKGAKRLESISTNAFLRQYFDSTLNIDNNILDFSECTMLRKIGKNAFCDCCDDNKNEYNAIIFPPNIRKIEENAFSCDNEKCRIRFHKVVFTDSNPPDLLFEDGIPRVFDKQGQDIVVPFGCRDKYIKLKYFDRTYSKNVYESTIKFSDKEEQHGSLKLSACTSTGGIDTTGSWTPVDETGAVQPETKLWLSDTFNGNMWIDDQGRINWKQGLPAGEYNLRVYGYKYDWSGEGNLLSAVCSPLISLSICNAALEGGTTHIYTTAATGQDTNTWESKVDTSTGAKQTTTAIYKLLNLPENLKNKVNLNVVDNKARILWSDLKDSDYGIYTFTLEATVKNDSENQFKIYKQIYFNVNVLAHITLQHQDKDSNWVNYIGEQVSIARNESKQFRIIMPVGYTYTEPQLSIEGITPTKVGQQTDTYEFTINNDGNKLKPGVYQFNAYSHLTKQDKSFEYDSYSDMFNIVITDDTSIELNTLPSQIDISKCQSGSKSIKLIKSDDGIITNINSLNAPWIKNDFRLGNNLIRFDVDPDDSQSILVSWTEDYSPIDANPYDVLDIELSIFIQSNDGTKKQEVHKALSVIATNESKISYESEEPTIRIYPEQQSYSSTPFKFEIVGTTDPLSVTWECMADESSSEIVKHISMVSTNDNEAYLTCDLTTTTVIDGLYNATVCAYDKNNMAVAYYPVTLDVRMDAKIYDVPEEINIVSGTAGKTEQRIFTFLGYKPVESPDYTIQGPISSHLSIDADGYICWDDKVSAGKYEILITSTVNPDSNNEYKAYSYTTINVSSAPEVAKSKANVGAIVGGTVGGTAAVGGATAGGIIGARKRRFKKPIIKE